MGYVLSRDRVRLPEHSVFAARQWLCPLGSRLQKAYRCVRSEFPVPWAGPRWGIEHSAPFSQLAIAGIAIWLACAVRVEAAPPVSVDLATKPGFPLNGAQTWIDAMKGLNLAGLRIRSAGSDEKERVENRGTTASPSYHVVGLLTDRNRLRLPGAEFAASDRQQIANWFEKLLDDGLEAVGKKPQAFGLTAEQLVHFHDQLIRPVESSSKGRRAGDVAREIVRNLPLESDVSPAATRVFRRNDQVLDELQGLSSGTALAALLRPLGLAAAPGRASGKTRLLVAESNALDETWPIGWPPQDSPYKVAPALFERLNVEIQSTPLSEALSTIQERVKIPFLVDHQALAREALDLSAIRVSYPQARTFYLKIAEQILSQSHLRSELRVDEAGKPLLWVFSTRRG